MMEVSDSDDMIVTGEERPGHRVSTDDDFNVGTRIPSQARHGCG